MLFCPVRLNARFAVVWCFKHHQLPYETWARSYKNTYNVHTYTYRPDFDLDSSQKVLWFSKKSPMVLKKKSYGSQKKVLWFSCFPKSKVLWFSCFPKSKVLWFSCSRTSCLPDHPHQAGYGAVKPAPPGTVIYPDVCHGSAGLITMRSLSSMSSSSSSPLV